MRGDHTYQQFFHHDQFTDADGGVSADFVAKLRGLDAKNSQNELSIKKSLTKSEEAFFDTGGKDTWDQ